MNKLKQKSNQQALKEKKLWFHQPVKIYSKKSLIIGSFIAIFIALTPYFFYLYEYVPEERLWVTSWFTYDSHSFENANFVIWVLIGKLIPLIFILIWFFTCRHWWYHALLVPITMYTYQIISLFKENLTYIDEFQLMHLIPVMTIIIPLTYLTRARLFNKINNVEKSVQELEDEIRIKPTSIFGFVKQYF